MLHRLPVLLGAGLLVFCWAHLAWNATVGSLVPSLHLRLTMPLGFKDQAGPVLSWANLLDGAYQRVAAGRIGLFSPIYEKSVRWKNQAYYSLLGMSATPRVIVGPGHQLVEAVYLREYCSRNAAAFAASADHEAQRIRALQDVVEARGQVFVYLLTPSKPAVYPATIPPDYPCPASLADREAKLPLWRAALRRAGVHVADAAASVYAARDLYPPMGMFPKGGIHWNPLAAALGAQALVETVNAQRKLLTPFTFDVHESMSPSESERDLHDILNLMQRSVRYPVPVLDYRRAGPPRPCPAPPRIVEVAGSFAFELDEALAHAPCSPRISLWWYWNNKHFLFPPGTVHPLPAMDAAERTEDLKDAQIVVLEENESLLPGSGHARHLMDELLPRTAASER